MPVQHMVWCKFHDGITAEQISEHVAGLKALPDHIPFVEKVEVGENFTDRARRYTLGIIVTLPDPASLPAYIDHEYHVGVATPLKRDAELMAMDIDVL